MKRLQVLINGEWKFVFCRNEQQRMPITTDNRLKAIKGDHNSLTYFQRHFSEHEFKITK